MKEQVMRTTFFKNLSLSLLALALTVTAQAQLSKTENIGRNRIGTVTDNGLGSYSFVAGGNDIWDNVDEFTYAYQEVSGDFDVKVRVESLQANARWTKGGIMVRESLAEDSRMLFPRVTPLPVPTSSGGNGANDTRFSYRTGGFFAGNNNGGQHEDIDVGNTGGAPLYPNAWLRLTRVGNVFTAYNGEDGSTWRLLGTQDTATWAGGAVGPTLLVGLGACRHSGGATAAAEFRDYAITQPSTFILASASSRGNPTGVTVTYTTAATPGALLPTSYTLDNGATVSAAVPGSSPNVVKLTTSTLSEGTLYTLTVTGAGTTPDPATTTFTHGAGYEARRITLERNMIPGDINFFLDSTAYRRGLPVSCQNLPPVAGNTLFEDVTPDTSLNENFSVKISGVLDITTPGDYKFFISSDDGSRLFLSSDENPANKVEIAREPAWNGPRQYILGGNQGSRGTPPANISALINLAVGRYYMEQSFSEGGGGNNASTAWESPGGAAVANGSLPIADSNFILTRSFHGNTFTTLGNVTIVRHPQPDEARAGVENGARFTVLADGTPDYTYQWQRSGDGGTTFLDVSGATSQTYTFTALPADDQAQYRVVVGNDFSSATSSAATLTVITDVEPPTLVSAGAVGDPTKVTVVFSEPVDEATAEDINNYSISGGVTISSATLQGDGRSVLLDTSPVNTPGTKVLTVNNVEDRFDNVIAANSQITITYAEGFIQRNFWKYTGGGGSVNRVTSDPKFPSSPDSVMFPTLFEDPQVDNNAPANEQFGVQFIGFITAPVSGNYNFWMSSDDNGVFWLSTDQNPANKVLICREPAWNGRREYINGGNQGTRGNPPVNRSTTLFPSGIPLVAGERYYTEMIFSEGGGGNNGSVTWQIPGGPPAVNGSTPIEGRYLSAPSDPPVIVSGPNDATVNVGQSATFTIVVTGTPLLHVTWFRGIDIVAQGDGLTSYTTPLNRNSDNGAQFSAVVTNRNGTATSRTATLTVNPDNIAPSVASAASFNGKTIGLSFSETMEASTISDPVNYSVDGSSPTGVVVRADNKSVILDMDFPVTGPTFMVVVNGGTDFAGNELPANSTVTGSIWATAQDITPSGIPPTRPNPPGSTNFTSNVGDADVIAGGADVWDTADEFHFIHNEVTGDFDVKVKVQRLDPSNRWAKGGIMARMNLAANSPTVQAYSTTPSATIAEFETGLRSTPGGGTGGWEYFRPSLARPNVWVRLRRNGNLFRAYYGSDGLNWSIMGELNLAGAPSMVFLGLMTTSHNISQNTTAEYRNYSAVSYPDCTIGFSEQPQSQTVMSNGPVQFSATVSANLPASELIHQWQRSADGGATFTNIPGANGTSYTIQYATAEFDANQFRLFVVGPGCTGTSDAATLTLTQDTVRPRVRAVLGPVFGTNVVVYFTEPMGDSAADNFSYTLVDSSGNPITITEAVFGVNNRARINLVIAMDTPLVAGQQYTLTASASDLGGGLFAGAVDYASNPVDPNPTEVTFTAQNINFDPDSAPTLPTTRRLPLGALVDRGFDGRFVDIVPQIPNNNGIAEQMLAGTYTDVNGNTVMNEAARICWFEPNVINWDNDAGAPGAFTGDTQFPGLSAGVDNIAMEVLAYAELRAGLHSWAVNSDDGFRVSPALGVNDVDNAITLGEFNGGRGAATTEFRFIAPEDGLYPFRLIWQEGQGGMNVEFWSRNLVDGTTALMNGAGGVPVFRVPLSVSPAANLSISSVGGNVVVSWPAASIGCLEGANNVSGPWTVVREATVLSGSTKSITIPRNQAMRFYRHVRPAPSLTP